MGRNPAWFPVRYGFLPEYGVGKMARNGQHEGMTEQPAKEPRIAPEASAAGPVRSGERRSLFSSFNRLAGRAGIPGRNRLADRCRGRACASRELAHRGDRLRRTHMATRGCGDRLHGSGGRSDHHLFADHHPRAQDVARHVAEDDGAACLGREQCRARQRGEVPFSRKHEP